MGLGSRLRYCAERQTIENKNNMNKFLHYPLLLAALVAFGSCSDDDQLDVTDIDVPDGYALSAGTSTGF